jgi:hypothetical protein
MKYLWILVEKALEMDLVEKILKEGMDERRIMYRKIMVAW